MESGQSMNLGTPLARVKFHPGQTSSGLDSGISLMTIHHALFDGWSYLQLLEDLQQIYSGDRLPPRPAFNLVIDYISKLSIEEDRFFWSQEFINVQAKRFPVFPRRPLVEPNWQIRSQQVALAKSDMNWALANKIKLAWALVISSQTSSNDVIYGLTVSGRNVPVPEINRIAGPTFATFPFRTQLDDDISVEDMLIQVAWRGRLLNVAMLTPSVARTLSPVVVPCLQTLILGGEPPSVSDLAMWASRVQLHQSYGPAECAMYTTTTTPLTPNSDVSNAGSSPNI
ncbi:hypothetical protein PDIDSM_2796 [Penicillium digitatum]|nr:hypothetical protein PDIDSM_2796 [Penicillium digitatum]